jgi:anti-sigma B factor antagonist
MTTKVNFEITNFEHNTVPVLAVRGEIDVATAPELRERLLALAEHDRTIVVVDLTDVSFVDSTALGVLVSSVKRLRRNGGDLRLVVTEPHIAKVLAITGLTEVFRTYTTTGEAVSA